MHRRKQVPNNKGMMRDFEYIYIYIYFNNRNKRKLVHNNTTWKMKERQKSGFYDSLHPSSEGAGGGEKPEALLSPSTLHLQERPQASSTSTREMLPKTMNSSRPTQKEPTLPGKLISRKVKPKDFFFLFFLFLLVQATRSSFHFVRGF